MINHVPFSRRRYANVLIDEIDGNTVGTGLKNVKVPIPTSAPTSSSQ